MCKFKKRQQGYFAKGERIWSAKLTLRAGWVVTLPIDSPERNRSRPVEDFRGWLLVEAGFDGGAEPLEHGAFLQAAGF